jgi:hypothetical protein
MSQLMKLAETLRDIAEECSKSEIEQALGLCRGFADRVSREREVWEPRTKTFTGTGPSSSTGQLPETNAHDPEGRSNGRSA